MEDVKEMKVAATRPTTTITDSSGKVVRPRRRRMQTAERRILMKQQ
jgi:hypothetical protein